MNPDLMAAIVAESRRTPEAALDLLLEMNATLCDVLLLYAGTPPGWSDGLSQDVLAEWLERTGDERAAKVCEDQMYLVRSVPAPRLPLAAIVEWEDVSVSFWPTEAAARRYLKRRVLGLFPEATKELCRDFDTSELPEMLHRREYVFARLAGDGFRTDLLFRCKPLATGDGLRYTQSLAAPNWIPPSEEERRRLTPWAALELAPSRRLGHVRLRR